MINVSWELMNKDVKIFFIININIKIKIHILLKNVNIYIYNKKDNQLAIYYPIVRRTPSALIILGPCALYFTHMYGLG